MTHPQLREYRDWGAPAFLVAEAGVNHEGDLDTALRMVEQAGKAGLDAIKFQTYRANRITTRAAPAYWDTSLEPTATQFELFARHGVFGEAEYRRIAAECGSQGILFSTSPFDVEAIDWLEELVAIFKVASGDITNVPLLRRIAATGKPVLLSTGASTIEEIEAALDTLRAGDVAVLHCTLAYPTPAEHAEIGALRHLERAFPDAVLGYSDHTVPPASFAAIEAAYALGGRVIEKHYTLDKTLPGNDHYHAFDPEDFVRLRARLAEVRELLGSGRKQVLSVEEPARAGARRSLVARGDIPAGAALTIERLDVKRPGTGIPPSYVDELAGWRAARDIPDDTTLEWEMLTRDGA